MLSYALFSSRVIHTRITAPTNATRIEPMMPPPGQIPSIPNSQPPTILEPLPGQPSRTLEETQHPCNPYASAHNSSPLFKFYLRYRTGPSRERAGLLFLASYPAKSV